MISDMVYIIKRANLRIFDLTDGDSGCAPGGGSRYTSRSNEPRVRRHCDFREALRGTAPPCRVVGVGSLGGSDILDFGCDLGQPGG
jgi:hypothetical protein